MLSRGSTILAVLCLLATASFAASAPHTLEGEEEARFAHLGRLIASDGKATPEHLAGQTFRREALILPSDRDPTDVLLRRTAALLEHLKTMSGSPDLSAADAALADLGRRAAQTDPGETQARRNLFNRAFRLRRRIAFANPLLDFDRILFVKRHFLPGAIRRGNHMCDQYFGFHGLRGGGVFVLEEPFGKAPTVRNLLADSACETGRFKGRRLPEGVYLSPDLSYDGRTVLFAFTEAEPTPYEWTPRSTYHLFRVAADGTGLAQLTDGPASDFDPCWLPDGRIAFISERRGGYGRCHARPVPLFTLHTMYADGTGIVCISPNEANEWHPSVDQSGLIVYTRWDYVDRGHSQAHHPWITTPDGRDARAIQGNYGKSMRARPFMELDVRAIPKSHRYVATAAAHHGQAYGSLVVLDPDVPDDDAMRPLKRLTPDVPFPEAERGGRPVYATAWPLSENFYLCVYDAGAHPGRGPQNNFGIYLIDAWGNRELLYRDPAVSCLSPMPLRPRPRPPVLAPSAAEEQPRAAARPTASIALINVYDTRTPFPEGTVIRRLRIVQVLPKTTPIHNQPRIGYGSEKGARAALGTVPVEADGSAYFRVPAGVAVYFQALDAEGRAVQSMRSSTWVHAGRRLVCQGCHERRHRAPPAPTAYPLALCRPPSEVTPEAEGSNPFSFARLVQPVLDRHCAQCHAKEPEAMALRRGTPEDHRYRWFTSYSNLREYAFFYGRFEATYDGWTAPRTTPGEFGARASRLLALLLKGHYGVRLPPDDLHRLCLWLDCNSDFFGSYEDTEPQTRGEVVSPSLE